MSLSVQVVLGGGGGNAKKMLNEETNEIRKFTFGLVNLFSSVKDWFLRGSWSEEHMLIGYSNCLE